MCSLQGLDASLFVIGWEKNCGMIFSSQFDENLFVAECFWNVMMGRRFISICVVEKFFLLFQIFGILELVVFRLFEEKFGYE